MAGKKRAKTAAVRKIKGKGDYEVSRASTGPTGGILSKLDKVLSRLPKGAFAAGGAMLGAKMGGARGASMGGKIGQGLSAISGYGDYTVKSNSLGKVSTSSDMVPQFVKNDHSVRVVHREFIKDLIAPESPLVFNNSAQNINPANSALFPWLARLSKQYSQYKIHGMVFVYKAMTSDYAAAGPLGTVVMATNYNVIDRDFANKIEMENSEFAVSCKPSMSLVHAIECDESVSGETVLYVRDPAYETTDTSDKRFYDYGKFQVATTGLQSAPGSVLGELWVSYDIEFMKPIIGGDTLVSPCPALVGHIDGSVGVVAGVNPSGRIPRVLFAQQITPATNTGYSVTVDGTVGYTITGDTGLYYNGVVDLGATTIIFRKNGRYSLQFRLSGDTSPSGNVLASTTIVQTGNSTVATTGTAIANITARTGRVASYGLQTASVNGYDCVITAEIQVLGIVEGTGATNFATYTPQTFVSGSAAMIPIVVRNLAVSWAYIAQNGQSVAFTPSV